MPEEHLLSNSATLAKYVSLDQRGSIQAEYIWIDSTQSVRSKTRTLTKKPTSVFDLPEWNFDGPSTGQAPGEDSDIYLRPVAVYPDPFRGGDNILVLTECWNADGAPNKFNYRHDCAKIMEAHKDQKPWFGLEQEYTLIGEYGHPYGWPKGGFPGPQGPYYCGVGTGKVYCRDIVEAHYKACLYARIKISGINAEVLSSQWVFQVGLCEGIEIGDQLWVSRYLLHRVAEDFGVRISFHPNKSTFSYMFLYAYINSSGRGDWNDSGLHTNVSTVVMRSEEDMIEATIAKLARHHISVYGDDSTLHLTGKHETGAIDRFPYGVADRGSSVHILRACAKEGYRPISNACPYQTTGIIRSLELLKSE